MELEKWQARLRTFAQERDWEQFHTPKNLAMALSVETSELLEIFQWLTPEESRQVMSGARAEDVADEIADIMIYLMRLADVLDVNLSDVVSLKVARNVKRFPKNGTSGRGTNAGPTRRA
jgi:NTP pyrophosphatase (non-canonical NTP hydrolase)